MENNCKDCGKHRKELKETPWGKSLGGGKWGIQCKPCREIEVANKIEEFKDKELETDYEDNIVCPICGTKHESDGEDETFYADGEHEFECGYCFTNFSVTTNVTYSYTSTKL